jgi:hypothetical protein
MQEDDRVIGSSLYNNKRVRTRSQTGIIPLDACLHLDIPLHALKVQTNSLLVKVSVLLDFQTGILGDRSMVTPRRGGQVDGFGVRVETSLVVGCDRLE